MRTEDQVRAMACLVQQSVNEWRRKGVPDAPKTMLEQAAFEQGRMHALKWVLESPPVPTDA